MDMIEPAARYHTIKARNSIIEKFKWPYEDWMQDWPLEIWQHIDLLLCVQEYSNLVDADEKFLLMEGILYALDEVQGDDFELFSQRVIELLKKDFNLHRYTIYYWTCYRDYSDEDEGFRITPLMRDVWNLQTTQHQL